MIIKLGKKDKELLTSIALQKVLTVSQLSAYYQRSRQAVRRQIRFFFKQ